MKKLLNRLVLFSTLLMISHHVQAKVTPVITLTDSCSNSDSVLATASKSTCAAGDTITYWSWRFTSTTSIPKAFSDTVSALVFKNPSNAKTIKDTIWLTVGTAHGDTDSVMKVFTKLYNALPSFISTSRCADSALSFLNQTDSSLGNGKYVWDFGDGSPTYARKNPANYSHQYSGWGTYYPVLTVYWPQTGCFNKTLKIANATYLYAKPFAKIVVTKAECQDSIVRFTNKDTTANSNLLQHSWDFGDGNGSGTILTDTTSHVYTSTGIKKVTYITITENGCRDTDTVSVVINPKPTANFSYVNPCQNAPATFTDKSSISGTGKISSWYWDFGDGSTSTTQNPLHTFKSPKTYRVKLVVTSNSGCIDSMIQSLTINSTPFMRIATTDLCLGLTNTITDMTSYFSTDTAQKWVWDFGDKSGTTNTVINNVNHKYTAAGKYHITMTATTQLGCNDTTGVYVNIFPLPTPNFSTAGGCSGQLMVFTDKSTVTNDTIQQQTWTFGDPNAYTGNPDIATGKKVTHAYDSAGVNLPVKLVVVTGGGCVDSISQNVTILQSPDTTFSTGTACENSSLQFKYTGRLTTGLKYNWNFGDSTTLADTSSSQNPTYTYAKGGLYSVTIVTKAQNGCRSKGTEFVYVFPKPYIWVTTDNICVDSVITFTANDSFDRSIANPPSIVSYTWDYGDGSKTTTTTNPTITHMYKSTGTYTVKLSMVTSDGCSNSSTMNLTIYPLPTASFTGPSYCNEYGIQFNNTSTGTITSYAWDYGDGGFDTIANPLHKFDNTDTAQTVTLEVVTDKGCRAISIQTIYAWQTPTSDFYYDNTPMKGCTFDTINLYSNSSAAINESMVTSYLWLYGDGTTDVGVNAKHTWSTDGTYFVRLVSYSQHGCPDTTNATAIKYRIIIYAHPVANFSLGNYTCQNAPVTFADSSTFGKTAALGYIYWDFGDGSTPVTGTEYPQHTYSDAGTYQVKIFVANNLSSNSCPSDTYTRNITIYPTPVANFGIVGTCQNRVTQFYDSSTVASPSIMDTTAYVWDFGDNLKANGTQNPSHTYISAGYYNVKLDVASTPGECLASTSKIIYVQPSPVAKFTPYPNPVGNDTPLVTFTDSSVGDFITTRYWDFGDSTYATNPTSNQHLYHPKDPIDTGTYLVWLKLTNKYSCSDSTSQYVKIKQFLKLDGRFPNAFTPNGDGLNDVWHPNTRGVFQYHCVIVDRWGQIVYKTDDWNDVGWKGDRLGDGKRVMEGLYVYYAWLTDYDNLEIKKVVGTITVLY